MIKIVYSDKDIIVCIKPSGVLSTDETGGMPELLKSQLNNSDLEIKTVHRLDRITSGLMVFAIGTASASNLSKQITDKTFSKKYLTVVHGKPIHDNGIFEDLLFRDTSKNMTYPVKRMRKGVRNAILEYNVLSSNNNASLCEVNLITGRTHQVRVQFSSRKMPVFGDSKYGASNDNCPLALWSYNLSFQHPINRKQLNFTELPPDIWPWREFDNYSTHRQEYEFELNERKLFREKFYEERI